MSAGQPGPSQPASSVSSTRSPSTYVSLLRDIILNSKDQALTLNEIYDQMERDHPDISTNRPGWKNTTRHCLSMQPCFQLREKPFPQPGRGGYWTVDLTAPDTYPRNRSRKKKQAHSLSPASDRPMANSSKKTRPSSVVHTNATASSSTLPAVWDSRHSDGEDGKARLAGHDSLDRDGVYEDGFRRPPQHPSWAPLHPNLPTNSYEGRLNSDLPPPSFPAYGYNPSLPFPDAAPAAPPNSYPSSYLYGPTQSYRDSAQQPMPTFQLHPRTQSRPEYPPHQQPLSMSYPGPPPNPPPPQLQAPPTQQQPFYPSYHPPPFSSGMGMPAHPGPPQTLNNAYRQHQLSPIIPSTSSLHPYPQQHLPTYYGQPLPSSSSASSSSSGAIIPDRPRSPVALHHPGPPKSSPSPSSAHPLHLASMMNAPAESGGLVSLDDSAAGGVVVEGRKGEEIREDPARR